MHLLHLSKHVLLLFKLLLLPKLLVEVDILIFKCELRVLLDGLLVRVRLERDNVELLLLLLVDLLVVVEARLERLVIQHVRPIV